jgi:hypothetical protein
MAQDRIDLNDETSMAHPEVLAVDDDGDDDDGDDDDDDDDDKLQRKMLQNLFSTRIMQTSQYGISKENEPVIG